MAQNRKTITAEHFQVGHDKCGVRIFVSVSEFSLAHQVSYCLTAATDDLNRVLNPNRIKRLTDEGLVIGLILNHQDSLMVLHSFAAIAMLTAYCVKAKRNKWAKSAESPKKALPSSRKAGMMFSYLRNLSRRLSSLSTNLVSATIIRSV